MCPLQVSESVNENSLIGLPLKSKIKILLFIPSATNNSFSLFDKPILQEFVENCFSNSNELSNFPSATLTEKNKQIICK